MTTYLVAGIDFQSQVKHIAQIAPKNRCEIGEIDGTCQNDPKVR